MRDGVFKKFTIEYRTIELKLLLQEFDNLNFDGKC